jgi:hypothetical protein
MHEFAGHQSGRYARLALPLPTVALSLDPEGDRATDQHAYQSEDRQFHGNRMVEGRSAGTGAGSVWRFAGLF